MGDTPCNRQDCNDLISSLTEDRDDIQKKYDVLVQEFKELSLKEEELTKERDDYQKKLKKKEKKLNENGTKIKQLENKITKQEGKIEVLQKMSGNDGSEKFTDNDRKTLNRIEVNSERIVQILGEQKITVSNKIPQDRMSTNIGEKLSKWDSKVTLIGKSDKLQRLFSNHPPVQKDLVKLERKGVVKKESVDVTGSVRIEEALDMKIGELANEDGNNVAIVLLDGVEPDEDLSGKILTKRIVKTTQTMQEVFTGLKKKFKNVTFLSVAVGKAKMNKELLETSMIDTFGNGVYSATTLNDGDAGMENLDGSWTPLTSALVFSSIYNIVAGSREEDICDRCLQCGLIHDKEDKCLSGLTFEEDCVVCGMRHEGAGKYCSKSVKECRYCRKIGHLEIIHTIDSSSSFKEKVCREYGPNFEFVDLVSAGKEKGGNEKKKMKFSSSASKSYGRSK